MSNKRAKVNRLEQDMLRQGVLLHDAQIAVLLDTLASHRTTEERIISVLERKRFLTKEEAGAIRERTIIEPEKYHRALKQLVEYRNREYGGQDEHGTGHADEERVKKMLENGQTADRQVG